MESPQVAEMGMHPARGPFEVGLRELGPAATGYGRAFEMGRLDRASHALAPRAEVYLAIRQPR